MKVVKNGGGDGMAYGDAVRRLKVLNEEIKDMGGNSLYGQAYVNDLKKKISSIENEYEITLDSSGNVIKKTKRTYTEEDEKESTETSGRDNKKDDSWRFAFGGYGAGYRKPTDTGVRLCL